MASKSNVEEAQTDMASEEPTRNWLELPLDLMLNFLQRVGLVDQLQNAELVCTVWRDICKDPAMWRVVYMDKYTGGYGQRQCRDMCKLAVDRSQGQLLDLTIIGFCDNDLLLYVVDRYELWYLSIKLDTLQSALLFLQWCCSSSSSYLKEKSSQLRRLEIIQDFGIVDKIWNEAFKKLPFCCTLLPLVKTLRLNKKPDGFWQVDDSFAFAIAKNLPELTHLQLFGSNITNTGLKAILDGCSHLESLDLRRCWTIDLKGDLGKRCSQQIKHLKLPNESFTGLPYFNYFVL
ncbi:putative F-box/LRR-repeat protein 23 [Bidens hawaiensis]|uniref:putative F-box/LRR-repeat protein 23 n=1 Tax=Bidens hawaiensis TaxID=980011 RepID=UPI0040493B27